VKSVRTLKSWRIKVTFVDGTAGEVDLREFLFNPKWDQSLFEPLRDPDFFAQAYVLLGAVTWPNGADLSPGAMYDEIKAHGTWVPE
jgi:hypothetical protein